MRQIKHKLLLVEDDINLGDTLKIFLELKGFEVIIARDGDEGTKLFRKHADIDLVILDVMLPKKDGFSLAKEIKNLVPNMPVIFLTAKSFEEDILQGFQLGADDYITKPFSHQVLLARINAILQRTQKPTPVESNIQLGNLIFDYSLQQLEFKGQVIELTSKEAEILKMLYENVNEVVPRSQLLLEIWKSDDYNCSRSLDVYMSKLRKKLSVEPKVKLLSVHASGYKLVVINE